MVKRPGKVYLGESTRSNGSKKIYTGITRRPVRTRWAEHKRAANSLSSNTWTGKGTSFRGMGAFTSNNPEKAERTIKRLKPHQKKYLARGAAIKYNKKKSSWF
jgi:predicted GIY-YIG superfamily endonuclease